MLNRLNAVVLVVVSTLAVTSFVSAQESPTARCYLIGNSLTWDTVPERLSGDVQWHVDCGVHLPHILANPDQPCVKSSTLWPKALADKQYDMVSVQPHYGSTLTQDADTISGWMKMQPKAIFVIHSGWAWRTQVGNEFSSYSPVEQMSHSPHYFRELISELRRRHPGREIRQTFAQYLLATIQEESTAGRAPLKEVAELYRDDIHLTQDHGKYLMHNAVRRAFGQSASSAGFEKLNPELKSYLDSVLSLLDTSSADKSLLARIVSTEESATRSTLIARLSDANLRTRCQAIEPEIQRAMQQRPAILALEGHVKEAGGRMVYSSSAPRWLMLATGDAGLEVFDVPASIDLYNGNNPLKGKGGKNDAVNDAWLKRLADFTSLKKLDLANCAVQGDGLEHIAGLTDLRELNLTLTPVKDDSLKHLANLVELRVLGLASAQCNGAGFAFLHRLKKLESVNFHFTPLNDAGLKEISQVPISGRLWFAHTKFTDAGAVHLSQLKQLKRCGIGSTDPGSTGEAVGALSMLPLEDLALLDNQATPAGVAHASKIVTLKRLDISHAPTVGDESLQQLAQLPALEDLKIGSATLSDNGLQGLAAAKSLKKLSLTGIKSLTPAGVERLRKSRPEMAIDVK